MPPLAPARGFSPRRTTSASVATLVSLTKLVRLVPDALSKRNQIAYAYGAYGAGTAAGDYGYGAMGKGEADEPETPPGSPDFVWKLVLSVGLVLLGGVFAGCVPTFSFRAGALLERADGMMEGGCWLCARSCTDAQSHTRPDGLGRPQPARARHVLG